jgi:hypothetical protein
MHKRAAALGSSPFGLEDGFVSRVRRTTRIFARRQGDFPQRSSADCKGKQRSMRAKKAVRAVCNAYENSFS